MSLFSYRVIKSSVPFLFAGRIPTSVCLAMIVFVMVIPPGLSRGQDKFEQKPILYSTTKPTDRVQQLADALASGNHSLEWNESNGYLDSILKELDVPVSSQCLVFSKTSLQVSRITPKTPRAIYFSDDIYLGWVQKGNVIEISAADPKLGATFYSLKQEKREPPVLIRETARCLQCHGAMHTRGRPGHIVRSVFPNQTGMPEYSLGTSLTSHLSEFGERFGGWYVTGNHGKLRHRGNVWLPETKRTAHGSPQDPADLDFESGANLEDLDSILDTSAYLSPHSDIVAMMVLQHQVYMHNLITEASFAGQQTAYDMRVMNEMFDRPADYESDSTRRRYDSAAERVVKGLLFCDEASLTSPIRGSSKFASEFENRGPFDARGRSLRQFDLESRMFKYPCSFLVYSDSFRQLPDRILSCIQERLDLILSGKDESGEYEHLTAADRVAIKEILLETNVLKPE